MVKTSKRKGKPFGCTVAAHTELVSKKSKKVERDNRMKKVEVVVKNASLLSDDSLMQMLIDRKRLALFAHKST